MIKVKKKEYFRLKCWLSNFIKPSYKDHFSNSCSRVMNCALENERLLKIFRVDKLFRIKESDYPFKFINIMAFA